jgi:threonine synthase
VLDLPGPLVFDPERLDPAAAGIWRYRHTFPLPADAAPVSLGEGATPLLPVAAGERTVHCKLEFLEPTGSFKDRGMAVMLTGLRAAGVTKAVEDSSGNAGASFAAYAARAGLGAQVFVPAAAAGPKRAQIAAYGAEVVAVEGARSKAAEAVRQAAAQGAVYASQLGRAPEAVVLPVGHGTLLLGLHRGFAALQAAGLIERPPRLVGVQAAACAPLWAAFHYGRAGLGWVTEGETRAEGIRVIQPVRGDAVLRAVHETGGTLLAVEEPALAAGHNDLGRLGLYVEPTSAAAWAVLAQVPGDVVVLLTGHGLKTNA